jgi:hypothetical protein
MNFGEASLLGRTDGSVEAIPAYFRIDPLAQFFIVDEEREGAPLFDSFLETHRPVTHFSASAQPNPRAMYADNGRRSASIRSRRALSPAPTWIGAAGTKSPRKPGRPAQQDDQNRR